MKFDLAEARDWPRVRGMLLPAIDRDGQMDEAAVLAEIESNMAQLWIGEDDRPRVAVVTCLSRMTRGLICEIWLLGGENWRSWIDFIAEIEDWARARGCHEIEISGRVGWSRLLPDYEVKSVTLSKPLA